MPLPAAFPFKAAALIVREFVPVPDAMVAPAEFAVPPPVNVRLLIVKFCSSVVIRFVAEFAVKMTFVVLAGSAKVSTLPSAEVAQLVVNPTV